MAEKKWDKFDLDSDNVLFPANLLTNEVLRLVDENRSAQEAQRLVRVLKSATEPLLGIFMHDNPDPDSIASAMALGRIAFEFGLESRIFHGGKIERADNKVFVYELDVRLERIANPEHVRPIAKKLGIIALVDCSVPGANNILPQDLKPDIVIDHHYTEQFDALADFVANHADLGACSTLMTKYLQDLNIQVEPFLASALLYGIRTDTKVFTRNTSSADLKATAYLSALADDVLLEMFESPPMDEKTMEMMYNAIERRFVQNRVLISDVGDLLDRDSLAQVADFLLTFRDVDTVVVFGRMGDTFYLSGRNSDKDINMGERFKEGFEEVGSAGGHATAAGAQLPIKAYESEQLLLDELKELFNLE
jgi:nanoRNase/pAp phosphatase (c-di-AMP/oligoRNAs hydrolase)